MNKVNAMSNEQIIPSGLLTYDEVVKRLALSRSTVYRMADRGDLETIKLGRTMYFTESSVEGLKEFREHNKPRTGRRKGVSKTQTSIDGLEPEMVLAIAIITNAIDEYKEKLNIGYRYCPDIDRFFRSKWFGTLSLGCVNPEELIRDLKIGRY